MRFWNLRVMAKDPWRLALGGLRILARRIFGRQDRKQLPRAENGLLC